MDNKFITISNIGYNHPSQANWNWEVYKLDLIDTDKSYNMSYVLKTNFGGNNRFMALIKSITNKEVIETKAVWPEQKITGIRQIKDLEDKETLEIVKEFLKVGVNYETNENIY
jgi:hypothetical protein